jgi:hypothetical protein
MRKGAILDCGQILGKMWTFLPKQSVILINPEFVDFVQTRPSNQNISGLFVYTFISGYGHSCPQLLL